MAAPPGFEFDSAYRGDAPSLGTAARSPWSIGEPQAALTARIEQSKLHSDVRDVGCREGAISLRAAPRASYTSAKSRP
jgi:2-heptyl-1-hydroxyquinolin-4(1H)-one methyltransferase